MQNDSQCLSNVHHALKHLHVEGVPQRHGLRSGRQIGSNASSLKASRLFDAAQSDQGFVRIME